jgi:outer membrane cobalamin receptor
MKKYITIILGLAVLLLPLESVSEQIEEIVVVGSFQMSQDSDVSQDFTIIETVMPTMSYTAGGYGGFAGFSERGTQAVHTTVYLNGVPANDAGSGWYDFAHDMISGLESVRMVSGPNGVLYGSGSLGGTVFINDNFTNQGVVRYSTDNYLFNATMLDSISVSQFNVNNGSVRNDNTESDDYKNTTVKFGKDFADFSVNVNYTDYDYDYDDCFTATFESSNNCLQQGEKLNVSLRNDNVTLGYNSNKSEYFTEEVSTWSSDAERYYLDVRENFAVGTPAADLVIGLTFNQDKYIGLTQDDFSSYAVITFDNRFQLGTRVSQDAAVYRIGYAVDGFFVNASTSYRNPTLYEQNGDAFVNSNRSLDPEEAFGWEIGYKGLSYFNYSFDQGIDYDFGANQFVNTGKYDTSGVRYMDMFAVPWGGVSIMAGYTDSDLPRVPKYKTRLAYIASVNGVRYDLSYTAQFDRGTDFTGQTVSDVKTVDFVVSKDISSNLSLSFTVQDLFDREFEIIPGYNAGGRTFFLTLTYR